MAKKEKQVPKEIAYDLFIKREQLLQGIQQFQRQIAQINQQLTKLSGDIECASTSKNAPSDSTK